MVSYLKFRIVTVASLCLSDFTTSAIIQLLLLRANISCLWNQHDITSFVIMRNLFSFRLNGVKGNYFCGELSHVSVLLAILCLSVLPQALLYSCYFCVPIFTRNIGNQDDITSFLIMRNLFSFRLNGRKSNYFCGEASYVSVLVVLLAILFVCFTTSAIIQFLLVNAMKRV